MSFISHKLHQNNIVNTMAKEALNTELLNNKAKKLEWTNIESHREFFDEVCSIRIGMYCIAMKKNTPKVYLK